MRNPPSIYSRGCIAWVNNVAARLLGVSQGEAGLRAGEVFGLEANHLAALTRETACTAHRLPNGLNVWLLARMQARDGLSRTVFQLPHTPARAPAAAPPSQAATLRDSDRDLITRTVASCDGNVSKAARQLGVSRGLVYRHLKASAPD